MRNSYRVLCHEGRYYTAQIRYWWLPFLWHSIGGWKMDLEEAKRVAVNHADPNGNGNITNLGKLP